MQGARFCTLGFLQKLCESMGECIRGAGEEWVGTAVARRSVYVHVCTCAQARMSVFLRHVAWCNRHVAWCRHTVQVSVAV